MEGCKASKCQNWDSNPNSYLQYTNSNVFCLTWKLFGKHSTPMMLPSSCKAPPPNRHRRNKVRLVAIDS